MRREEKNMTQKQLNCQVAKITGEPLLNLCYLGSTWWLETLMTLSPRI
jgi:hypothetical protein